MLRALTHAEHERIDAAVAAAKAKTGAEFSAVVTRVSDRYALYPLVWAAAGALIAAGIAALLWPELAIGDAFIIQVPAFVVLALAFDWLPLRLMLVPRRVKHHAARRLAHRDFAALIAAGGGHRNRALLFVSLGERYVEILADSGVHAQAAQGTWDRIVADFVRGVGAGNVADAVVGAVEALGAVLAANHPRG